MVWFSARISFGMFFFSYLAVCSYWLPIDLAIWSSDCPVQDRLHRRFRHSLWIGTILFDFFLSRIARSILVSRLQDICQKEAVECSGEALETLIEASDGDLRRAITFLQSTANHKTEAIVSVDDINEITGVSRFLGRSSSRRGRWTTAGESPSARNGEKGRRAIRLARKRPSFKNAGHENGHAELGTRCWLQLKLASFVKDPLLDGSKSI